MAMPSDPGSPSAPPWIRSRTGPGKRPRTGPRIRSRRGYALAAMLTATTLARAVPAVGAATVAPTKRGGTARPTIVLVHGAFADASSWREIVPLLQSEGHHVMAPANPLRGPAADTAYLAGVLRSVEGPVVLVGHSYAGAVISGAAVGNPQVKALVYINALVPDTGELLSVLTDRFPGSELTSALTPVPFTGPDGSVGTDLYVKPELYRPVLAASLPPTTTAVLAASQRPIDARAFSEATGPVAWRTVPSWALVSRQDRAVPPELERFEARRARSHTLEIDSPHLAMLAHPKAVTDLILDAAGSRSSTRERARTALAATGPAGAPGPGSGSTAQIVAGAAGAAVVAGAGMVSVVRRRRPTES
ncbi:alpha/beta fold hydrolase [Streptomyces lushanensis]|uniref:alpha/beta fold hydrolase n=1 Tax=Streptomyces lushanensis TaxID=1434255 RepID=UPI000831DC32|nr:alpha/beta hydrolase [Streptomyces lushanensis]